MIYRTITRICSFYENAIEFKIPQPGIILFLIILALYFRSIYYTFSNKFDIGGRLLSCSIQFVGSTFYENGIIFQILGSSIDLLQLFKYVRYWGDYKIIEGVCYKNGFYFMFTITSFEF